MEHTLEALAQAVGYDPDLLRRLLAEGAPFRSATGRGFSKTRTERWLRKNRERVQELTTLRETGDSPALDAEVDRDEAIGAARQALIRQRRVRAEMDELKLRRLKGELIHVAEVQRRDIARIQATKRALLGLVRSLPPALEGLRAQEMGVVLEKAIRNLLTRFSNM